jgi:peptidyl-prolyl cis-trans isomerase B (cyclophilin B)
MVGRRGLALWSALLLALVVAAGCASEDGKKKKKVKATPNPVAEQYRGVEATVAIDGYIESHPVDKSAEGWKTRVPPPPFVAFPEDRTYYWILDTNQGMLKIRLLPEYSPRHVSTTIYLTRLGFYNGLKFHRVIPQFMAQGGDPLGTGAGGPGFRYAGEFHKKAKHDERGIVSSANRGPRTDGSQFFILFKEQPSLDGRHTVFGEVVEGRGTLRSMEGLGSKKGEPRADIIINRAEIFVE